MINPRVEHKKSKWLGPEAASLNVFAAAKQLPGQRESLPNEASPNLMTTVIGYWNPYLSKHSAIGPTRLIHDTEAAVSGRGSSREDVRTLVIGLQALHREERLRGEVGGKIAGEQTRNKEGTKGWPTIMSQLMTEIVFTRHLLPPISPNNEANSSLSRIKARKLELN